MQYKAVLVSPLLDREKENELHTQALFADEANAMLSLAKFPLRKAAIYCLVIWVAIWMMWMLMRFSPFDIRNFPGIGPILLASLATALVAPLLALVLAGAALFREPRSALTWLTLICAGGIESLQVLIFSVTKWM